MVRVTTPVVRVTTKVWRRERKGEDTLVTRDSVTTPTEEVKEGQNQVYGGCTPSGRDLLDGFIVKGR